MAEMPNNVPQDEILEDFQAYFINIIHENKHMDELLDDLRRQLKEMEMKEAQHTKDDEDLKAELKKAKETSAEMASMNAVWEKEKKQLGIDIARLQTSFNVQSATNIHFKENNEQLSTEINQLETEKKLAEQNLRLKEIKKLTLKSKLNHLSQQFHKMRGQVATCESDVKKVRLMTGEYIMKAKAHTMNCEESIKEYRRVVIGVEERHKQLEEIKQSGDPVKIDENKDEIICDVDVEGDNEKALIDHLMVLKMQNAKSLQDILDLEKPMNV